MLNNSLTKKYKILLINPDLEIGGVETVFLTLANEWSMYCDVTFCLFQDQGALKDRLSDKVKIVSLSVFRLRSAFLKLRSYIASNNFDFVISGKDALNIALIAIKYLTNVHSKFILTQHNYLCFEDNRCSEIGKKIFPYIMHKTYPRADKVIAVSEGIKQYVLSLGVNPRKISCIYNPLNIDEVLHKSELPIVCECFDPAYSYITFCGRLSDLKNVQLLIRAFVEVQYSFKNTRLLLIGDGAEKENLLRLAHELQLDESVIFVGSQSNPYNFIRHSVLLVLPSLSEAWGMVLLEAMALGVTPVATPTNGAIEIIGDGYGYIAPDFQDPSMLAATIIKALRHPIAPEKLRKRAKQHAAEIVAKQYYKELIAITI